MSQLITVQDVKDGINNMLPTNYVSDDADLLAFVNRAARRLVKKAPIPHLTKEIDATIVVDVNSPEGSFVLDVSLYDHVKAFRNEDNKRVYNIAPLSDRFLDAHTSRDNFIDIGLLPNYQGDRYYEVPETSCDDLEGVTLKALVKCSYIEVTSLSDYLPFSAIGGIKLALTAVFYEDKGETNNAKQAWLDAIQEETESSIAYRGPVYPTLKFYGTEALGVTQSVY